MRAPVAADIRAIFNAPDQEEAEHLLCKFLDRYATKAPKLAKWAEEALPQGFTVFGFPATHRRRLRTTNLVERSFVEERRRTKTLPRFFTERSCLKLVRATLIRAGARWQRVRVTPLECQQLNLLFEERTFAPAKRLDAVA